MLAMPAVRRRHPGRPSRQRQTVVNPGAFLNVFVACKTLSAYAQDARDEIRWSPLSEPARFPYTGLPRASHAVSTMTYAASATT